MKCWWIGLGMLLSGCFSLTPEMIAALAKDNASFCAKLEASGGAGALSMVPTGGYGASSLMFCRSMQANARVSITKDSIVIQHGAVVE